MAATEHREPASEASSGAGAPGALQDVASVQCGHGISSKIAPRSLLVHSHTAIHGPIRYPFRSADDALNIQPRKPTLANSSMHLTSAFAMSKFM